MCSSKPIVFCSLILVIWLSCVIERSNPSVIKSRKNHIHIRVPRAIREIEQIDDDVEMIETPVNTQKSSSIKVYKPPTSKTAGRQTELESDEIVEEEEEEETVGIKIPKKSTTKQHYTEQEFVDEMVAAGETEETTEDRIRHMFGNGLVCLDVDDEKTKTTPSFQALVQELTRKYGKKPHIHTPTRPTAGNTDSNEHRQEEFEYFVYDQVEEKDPVTHRTKKVQRRRVTTHEEFTEYSRRNKKVLRKIKKKPKCTEPGLIGDENDCTKFYECTVPAGTKGTPKAFDSVLKDCPPGTIFDDTISTCNHIWAVDPKPPCWDEEDDDDGAKGQRGTERPTNPDDDDENETVSQTKKPWKPAFPGQTQPVEEIVEDKPPCRKAGFFELPNECHRGYQCLATKGHVEFKQYLNCDEPEVFLESEGDCVPASQLPANHRCRAQSQIRGDESDEDPENVGPDFSAPPSKKTGSKTTTARPTTTKPPVKFDPTATFVCEKNGKFPHATKCDTYHTCLVVNKKLRSTTHKCAAGTLFDIEHEMCSPQESIKNRPECADHDTKVDWPKTGDQQGEDDDGNTQTTSESEQGEDDSVVDFDEDEIENYTDENGIVKKRLKKSRKITYEYEEEDPVTKKIRKIRKIIKTRKVTRGEQTEELQKIVKKKIRKITKRKVEPADSDDGQQTDDQHPDDPDNPPSTDEDDDEPDEIERDFSQPPKKGGGGPGQSEDNVPPSPINQHNCDDQLSEIETLKQERDDALKSEAEKEKIVKTLKIETEKSQQIIEEKDELINDLKNYKQNTQELVETLKVERDEAQELVETVRSELEKIKVIVNQMKVQKEVDDAEIARLRKELASCNHRVENMRKVMEGNDLALKSCKQEVTTLQQCCDDEEQSVLVKSRKKRSEGSKNNFQKIVQGFEPSNTLGDGQNKETLEPDIKARTPVSLSLNISDDDGKGQKSYQIESGQRSSSAFQEQLPLLIFIFLTLLLLSVILLGCSVIRKLSQITTFAVASDEFETTYQDSREKLKSSEKPQKQAQKSIFNNQEENKKTNSYFAYVDE